MVHLKTLDPKPGVEIHAKLEFLNPTGSIKDRIVEYMVQKGIDEGYIKYQCLIINLHYVDLFDLYTILNINLKYSGLKQMSSFSFVRHPRRHHLLMGGCLILKSSITSFLYWESVPCLNKLKHFVCKVTKRTSVKMLDKLASEGKETSQGGQLHSYFYSNKNDV